MLSCFNENGLIAQNQSGFKPEDSCLNHLFSSAHEMYKSFNDGWELRDVFLDISKAYEKFLHQAVLLKIKQKGISKDVIKTLKNFIENQYQRLVLNGQISRRTAVNPGFAKSHFVITVTLCNTWCTL